MNKLIISICFAALWSCPEALANSPNPGSWSNRYVDRDSSDVYYETFYSGRVATVNLTGDCSSDIDLWIYDENDNLVAKSTSTGCDERASWIPEWTGSFKIVVENSRKPYGSYYNLATN